MGFEDFMVSLAVKEYAVGDGGQFGSMHAGRFRVPKGIPRWPELGTGRELAQ